MMVPNIQRSYSVSPEVNEDDQNILIETLVLLRPYFMVQPSCISSIQINVTKPRLEGNNSRVLLFSNEIDHYHCHRVHRESDNDGCSVI